MTTYRVPIFENVTRVYHVEVEAANEDDAMDAASEVIDSGVSEDATNVSLHDVTVNDFGLAGPIKEVETVNENKTRSYIVTVDVKRVEHYTIKVEAANEDEARAVFVAKLMAVDRDVLSHGSTFTGLDVIAVRDGNK